MCGPREGQCEKGCEIQGGGQEMAMLTAEILIMTVQVNLCCLLHVSQGFGIKLT